MADYRLLISLEVVEFVERLPRRVRLGIRAGIVEINDDPLGVSDAVNYDSTGRVIHVYVVGEYALLYWVDDADRYIKILDIHSADR